MNNTPWQQAQYYSAKWTNEVCQEREIMRKTQVEKEKVYLAELNSGALMKHVSFMLVSKVLTFSFLKHGVIEALHRCNAAD